MPWTDVTTHQWIQVLWTPLDSLLSHISSITCYHWTVQEQDNTNTIKFLNRKVCSSVLY